MAGETGNRDRWEHLKDLGVGGQGRVTLVRDRGAFKSDSVQATISGAIKDAGAVAMHPRNEWFDEFRRAIIDIVNSELPKNQGALKQLHEPGSARDPDRATVRMLREIDVMSRVDHPSLLRILDSNSEQGWYVSEYHPNGTLAKRNEMFEGDFPAALRAMRPLISGVAMLHEDGLVHRDIKPANVFLSATNELILGDFGLVHLDDGDQTRISDTYENVGSRDWMAPWTAVLRVEKIPPSADVFSLGKLLWSMVSGKRVLPFWYYDKPDYDVKQLFGGSPYITFATDLFKRTIVEEEEDCLPDAGSLLDAVDQTLQIIGARADPISDSIERKCKVCGLGKYRLRVDRDPVNMENFGILAKGVHTMKIFHCGHCGHVQLFSFDEKQDPPAWSKDANPG